MSHDHRSGGWSHDEVRWAGADNHPPAEVTRRDRRVAGARTVKRSGANTAVSQVPEILCRDEGALPRPLGADEHNVKEGEAL